MSLFNYESVPIPDAEFIISPSQIGKFFESPRVWYEENVLKKHDFKGNTSTVLGTICHHIYEQVTLGHKVDRETINKDLDEYVQNNPDLELDVNYIKNTYPLVTKEVVNEYVLTHNINGVKAEFKIHDKVKDNIYVGGTCDRLEGTAVVDYKTVSVKPSKIPFHYKIQLLAYAYILTNRGYTVDTIRLVYGVTPTKTIGARCVILEEPITIKDWKLISDTLKLIADTVIKTKSNPELIYLLYKSYELKEN